VQGTRGSTGYSGCFGACLRLDTGSVDRSEFCTATPGDEDKMREFLESRS
jgi:hypothetical protein